MANGVVLRAEGRHRAFFLKLLVDPPAGHTVALAVADAVVANSTALWHVRCGHASYSKLQQLSKQLSRPLNLDASSLAFCSACAAGKATRHAHVRVETPDRPDDELLGVVQSDLIGPVSPPGPNGERYVASFVDRWSRFAVVAMLKAKSELFPAYKANHAYATAHTGNKVKVFKSDGGGEYVGAEMRAFHEVNGTVMKLTSADSSASNGIVEVHNRGAFDKTRCLMHSAGLPPYLWVHAFETANYLKNRTPASALAGALPFTRWHGKMPDLSGLRAFGCFGFLQLTNPDGKVGSRTVRCRMIGYPSQRNGYRVLIEEGARKGKVVESMHVTFDERFVVERAISPSPVAAHPLYHVHPPGHGVAAAARGAAVVPAAKAPDVAPSAPQAVGAAHAAPPQSVGADDASGSGGGAVDDDIDNGGMDDMPPLMDNHSDSDEEKDQEARAALWSVVATVGEAATQHRCSKDSGKSAC